VYSYPPARIGGDVDDYHGEQIADPYRWLETTTDPETVSWIKAENELTDSYLAAVPARESIREQLTALWDYPRAGAGKPTAKAIAADTDVLAFLEAVLGPA